MNSFLLLAVLASGMCLAGCSTPLSQRLERSDGLIDFIAGSPGEVTVRVAKVSVAGGTIESAHVRRHGKRVSVSGYALRVSLVEPQSGAHVDVIVLDKRGCVVEAHANDYLPTSIPYGQRGSFAHSRFTVRLKALPPAGGAVRVIFHNQSKSICEINAISCAMNEHLTQTASERRRAIVEIRAEVRGSSYSEAR